MTENATTDLPAGRYVRLVPLDPSRHTEALHVGSHGAQRDELWRYLRDGPFADVTEHRRHLEHLCASGQFSGFAVIDVGTSEVLGQTALMKHSVEHRSAEIGYVLFLPALQRTRGGTEALYLLMRHGFETLKLRRCEWRCDSQNVRSERAALRLGFQPEGLLRQHMVVKGRNRDTMIFSLLDGEWPAIRSAFVTWLSANNFDHDENAQRRLEDIRASHGGSES